MDVKISSPGNGYAGNVTPSEAWRILKSQPKARLVDVRTKPEWGFVGLPDLTLTGGKPVLVEWQIYPDMSINNDFVAAVEAEFALSGLSKDAPVFLLCRSGARSRSGAMALTQNGFTAAYNVENGFEGSHDAEGHRGRTNGWKAEGLPWKQG